LNERDREGAAELAADDFVFTPIGVARTPFGERVEAPRQAVEAKDAIGTIELHAGRGFDDALDGLETFSHVWVLFGFHLNRGIWKPKVLPPRSRAGKVGVFASRSPHRPNPIGMSVVELLGVEGRIVRVRGLDILDGSPVFDLKPYVAYADAIPNASEGWVVSDPLPPWRVRWDPAAEERARWLEEQGVPLRREIDTRLALGPQAHAYRRIKTEGGRTRIAWKDWRAFFRVDDRALVVETIASGYRASQLASPGGAPDVHRAFAARFPGA
jgi:tRNA-Thr(GGU) m(6)t(6)A37 methyltransferase TsaA